MRIGSARAVPSGRC